MKKTNRPIDKLKHDDDDHFFRRKNIFLNMKKKNEQNAHLQSQHNLQQHNLQRFAAQGNTFEALKLERKFCNLKFSRNFGTY